MEAFVIGTPSSSNRFLIHVRFATVLATPLYSASELDRETVGCRLDDQEMRLGLRYTQ